MMIIESLREIYAQFKSQGVENVYGTRCCGRVYLGLNEALRCRTCAKTPKNIKVSSDEDLNALVGT